MAGDERVAKAQEKRKEFAERMEAEEKRQEEKRQRKEERRAERKGRKRAAEGQAEERDEMEGLGQEVRQAEPLHLPPPHVLQEPVKCRLGRPRDLDGVICSLDIADESRVGINHNLLGELNKYQCQSSNWSHTKAHSRCPGTSPRLSSCCPSSQVASSNPPGILREGREYWESGMDIFVLKYKSKENGPDN